MSSNSREVSLKGHTDLEPGLEQLQSNSDDKVNSANVSWVITITQINSLMFLIPDSDYVRSRATMPANDLEVP